MFIEFLGWELMVKEGGGQVEESFMTTFGNTM
jgi:hypothetical protein